MPVTVRRHIEWMRQRGLSEATIQTRSSVLMRLAAFIGVPLCEATRAAIAEWRASLSVGDDSIVTYVSHVHSFYDWLVRAELIDANPATGLPVPKLGRRLPRPIGEDELLAAVEAARPRIRPWLVLAGWAGLRAKEIALLRRPNVLEHAAEPVIIIAADATKGHDERAVPMSPFVLAEIAPLLPRAGWVFHRADGQPGPNRPSRVSQACNAYLDSVGIDYRLHQLRHRFLTQAYWASRDIRVVQELAGHRRVESTAGYTKYDQAGARAAVDAIPAPRHLRVVSE